MTSESGVDECEPYVLVGEHVVGSGSDVTTMAGLFLDVYSNAPVELPVEGVICGCVVLADRA